MLWAGSKARPRELYLGSRRAAWCDSAGATVSAPVEGIEAALAWAQGQLDESGYQGRLRLWLSGGLCRPFLLPPLPGVSGAQEILRVASRLANERTGLPGACRVWLDGPRHDEARMAVALEQDTLDRLQAALGSRWRIDAILPWWAEVLKAALARKDAPSALGVQDCDALTILIGKNKGFDMATTIHPVHDDASADSAFTRALLSADIEQGGEMLARLVPGRSASPADPTAAGWMEFSR